MGAPQGSKFLFRQRKLVLLEEWNRKSSKFALPLAMGKKIYSANTITLNRSSEAYSASLVKEHNPMEKRKDGFLIEKEPTKKDFIVEPESCHGINPAART